MQKYPAHGSRVRAS